MGACACVSAPLGSEERPGCSAVAQIRRRTGDVPGIQFYPRPNGQLGSSEPLECDVPSYPASEQGVADAFHRFIAEGIEPGISGRNNLQTLAVCEMLVRSARDRRPVERSELD